MKTSIKFQINVIQSNRSIWSSKSNDLRSQMDFFKWYDKRQLSNWHHDQRNVEFEWHEPAKWIEQFDAVPIRWRSLWTRTNGHTHTSYNMLFIDICGWNFGQCNHMFGNLSKQIHAYGNKLLFIQFSCIRLDTSAIRWVCCLCSLVIHSQRCC